MARSCHFVQSRSANLFLEKCLLAKISTHRECRNRFLVTVLMNRHTTFLDDVERVPLVTLFDDRFLVLVSVVRFIECVDPMMNKYVFSLFLKK